MQLLLPSNLRTAAAFLAGRPPPARRLRRPGPRISASEVVILSWAIAFFILALVAAFFGFGGIASSAAGIAKVLLVLFVIGFIVSLVLGWRGPGRAARRDDLF